MKLPDASPCHSSDAIEGAAAGWLARRYGGFSAADAAAFQTWLAADPRHAAAFADLEKAWQVVSAPGSTGQGAIALERHFVRERHKKRARRRRATVTTLTFAAAALLAFAFLPTRWHQSEPPPSGIVVRPDLQRLPDGSTVQLNAGTEIEPAFTPEIRLVRLVRGEALFTVAKDAGRPFVVSAGGVEVRAVGTAFTVRFDPKQVDVLVTEGTVLIAPSSPAAAPTGPAPSSEPTLLSAGNRRVIPLTPDVVPAVAAVTPAQIATALAWRNRRIEFTKTPLREAVDLFNRQNEIQLSVADVRTGNFEISGIFWADDPDGFVRLMETAFEMSTERSSRKVVVRRR